MGVAVLVACYFFAAAMGASIPLHSNRPLKTNDTINVFLITNRFHIDLAVPLRSSGFDWCRVIDPEETRLKIPAGSYISFGWGDSAFFRETPTWDDLRFKPAARAICGLGSPALHVTFRSAPRPGNHCKKIQLSREDYLLLVSYIKSFIREKDGNTCYIPNAGYSYNDLFCESTGTYSMFFNCNTWTNECLKSAHCRSCLWTPFEYGVMRQYP